MLLAYNHCIWSLLDKIERIKLGIGFFSFLPDKLKNCYFLLQHITKMKIFMIFLKKYLISPKNRGTVRLPTNHLSHTSQKWEFCALGTTLFLPIIFRILWYTDLVTGENHCLNVTFCFIFVWPAAYIFSYMCSSPA